jgi:hypothetical protein
MLRNTQMQEMRTIAAPEIDLSHGRPDARLTVIRTGWALALVIIAAGCAGALGWVWPRDTYDWSWGRAVASGLLGIIAVAGLAEATRTYRALRYDEAAFRDYLEDRRTAHLDALAQNSGQNIERTLSQTEIDISRFSGVLQLIVYARLTRRATISDFTGPLLLQAERGGRAISVGSASKYTAELATQELERIGVLQHNGEGRARTVREEPLEDLIWRAVDRWGKA